MCCAFLLFGFLGPRAALVYLWLTHYFDSAFQTMLWPLLGFVFMPFTTLAYAVAMHNGGVNGIWMLVLLVTAILDLGVHGGSARQRGRRSTD